MSTHLSVLAILMALPPAFAADCEGLSSLALPDTTLTAKAVAAGSFKLPNGQALADLPAFCEVHGVSRPTESSVIHFEVWLPESG